MSKEVPAGPLGGLYLLPKHCRSRGLHERAPAATPVLVSRLRTERSESGCQDASGIGPSRPSVQETEFWIGASVAHVEETNLHVVQCVRNEGANDDKRSRNKKPWSHALRAEAFGRCGTGPTPRKPLNDSGRQRPVARSNPASGGAAQLRLFGTAIAHLDRDQP